MEPTSSPPPEQPNLFAGWTGQLIHLGGWGFTISVLLWQLTAGQSREDKRESNLHKKIDALIQRVETLDTRLKEEKK